MKLRLSKKEKKNIRFNLISFLYLYLSILFFCKSYNLEYNYKNMKFWVFICIFFFSFFQFTNSNQ